MTDGERSDVARLVEWARRTSGDRRAVALLALVDRVESLERENGVLRAMLPSLSLRVCPDESYIVVPGTLPDNLRRLGVPIPSDWVSVRRAIVASCANSQTVPGSESRAMKFAARVELYGVPLVYLCEVMSGSPAGRQSQTVVLRGALRPSELRLATGRKCESEPVSV